MGEEHLHPLSEFHRDVVLAGLGDVASNLTGVFMLFAGDLAGVRIRAALRFRRASLAGQSQRAIPRDTFPGWPAVRVRVVPAELFRGLPFGADVLIVLGILFEV